MRSRLWMNAVLISLAVLAACAPKEQAPVTEVAPSAATPAGSAEKTYPLRGRVVSIDPSKNQVTVDHEKVEGLWEPMTMAFEVRGGDPGSLPSEGTMIRATLHVQEGRYWLTDVRPE